MHTRFRTRFLAATIALVFGVGIVASAQSNPDLSGTWQLAAAPAAAPAPAEAAPGGRGGRGGGGDQQLTIKQDAKQLTVTRGTQTFIYNLDGTEMPGPPGGETKSTIAWEGGKLVVNWKREYYAGAQGFKTNTGKDVYTLNGTTLTVERTTVNAGASPVTRTFTYNKAS